MQGQKFECFGCAWFTRLWVIAYGCTLLENSLSDGLEWHPLHCGLGWRVNMWFSLSCGSE